MLCQYDFSVKIIVIGKAGVGKTCFLERYTKNIWLNKTMPTHGVEFIKKEIITKQHKIQVQLWDTAGHEVFDSLTRAYYKNSAGILVIFDLTFSDSFKSVGDLIQTAKEEAGSDVSIVLIGNKSDDKAKRTVPKEAAEEFALSMGIKYFETSAKTGENVEKAVNECISLIEHRIENRTFIPHYERNKLDYSPAVEKKKCNC